MLDIETLIVDKRSMEEACAILAKEGDMSLPSFPSFMQGTPEEFFKNAGIQYRLIELKDQWWKHSYGNILAFYKGSGKPVALIYRGEAEYELREPSLPPQKVDNTVNDSLAAYGYMIIPSPKTPLTGFFKIFSFCSRWTSKEYAMLGLTGFVSSLLILFFPFANKIIFDRILPNFNFSLLVQVIIGLVLASTGSALFMLLRTFFLIRLNGIVESNLQFFVWQKLFLLPLSFFRSLPIGDLLQRTMVLEQIRRNFNDATIRVAVNSLFSLLYLAIMLFFSWELTVIVVQIILITFIFITIVAAIRIKYLRKQLALSAKINSFLIQVVSGISKLRVAEAINRVFSLWAEDFSLSQQTQFRAQKVQNYLTTWIAIAQLLIPFIIFAGIAYLLRIIGSTSLSIGSFLAFYSAMTMFTAAIFDLAAQIPLLTNLVPFWERTKVIFTTPQEEMEVLPPPGILSGDIKVENLSFRYNSNSPYVLTDVNMTIPKGAWVGLMGPSGAGKSTLCKLLVGLEKPQQGQISYDGRDIRGVSLTGLRDQIGVLIQTSSAIFAGSLYDNIACGHHYPLDEMMATMEETDFAKDLKELPMGLNTPLLTGGFILSGGQRQRLLLTRALIRKPKILILDEAMNSLDWFSQQRILNAISKKMEMTKIVISHSPKFLKYADIIYTLSDGKMEKNTIENMRHT